MSGRTPSCVQPTGLQGAFAQFNNLHVRPTLARLQVRSRQGLAATDSKSVRGLERISVRLQSTTPETTLAFRCAHLANYRLVKHAHKVAHPLDGWRDLGASSARRPLGAFAKKNQLVVCNQISNRCAVVSRSLSALAMQCRGLP